MTREEAIELLRPSAQARSAVVQSMGKPSAWRGRKEQREHAKRQAAARVETETELVRDAQVCGVLPSFLLPLIWKLIWPIAWEAIKYWLNNIHPKEQV